jgi:stage IV sporulation protein FB
MKNSFKLFYFFGTPVYLKYLFFILLILGPIYFISILLAVLIHELAHAYIAKKVGCNVSSVFIDMLYGGALIDMGDTSHKEDIYIISVGPLSNLLLFIFGYLLLGYTDTGFILDFLTTFNKVNLTLFIFNILPIFPMDGGRISKSTLSIIFGNKLGKYRAGVLSIITCTLLMLISSGLVPDIFNTGMFPNIVICIFTLYLLYLSYNEIK